MKKSKLRQQQRRKYVLLGWSLLGLIGLLWLCSLPVRLVAGLLQEKEAVASKESMVNTEVVQEEALAVDGSGQKEQMGISGEAAEPQEVGTVGSGQSAEGAENNQWKEECQRLYQEYEELLVLVNKENALEEGAYEDTLRSICNGRLQASDYLYEDLVDLLAAADEEGYQYWIASAYRSRQRQQELVDEDVNHYMAQGMSRKEALEKTYEQTMPAGKSEHETGLALDLLCSENLNMDVTQADEPGNQWLAAHAHEYGFILRYPEDKEAITDIYYEPWHFRYVGKEAAKFLYEQGWTLEEFHAELQS